MESKPYLSKGKFTKYASELGFRIFNIKSAYIVWRELGLHTNSRVGADTSKKYLEVINQHKGFFVPIIGALENYIINELHTLFTRSKEKSVPDFVRVLKSEGKNFESDLELFMKQHKDALGKIKTVRHKLTAHKDKKVEVNKIEVPNIKQYDELFHDMERLFNKITSEALNSSFWFYEDNSTEAQRDTHLLMDNLLRGETQRINENDVNYYRDLFNIGRSKWYDT